MGMVGVRGSGVVRERAMRTAIICGAPGAAGWLWGSAGDAFAGGGVEPENVLRGRREVDQLALLRR